MTHGFSNCTAEERARKILEDAYGPEATFRPGQLEAIAAVIAGRNSLVIQKTGWGKSLVYFIATKILRQDGAGPSLIISPLLSLMDNQVSSAGLLGVRAVTINSDNRDDWDSLYSSLDEIDAIIVSPERLGNDAFMERLSIIRNIKLLVIDEAHCISDWGHDFRPDYQRVRKIIDGLPDDIAILGTTATANDRVIADIRSQLGDDLAVVRGDLIRSNIAIQVNPEQTREQRLAWLAQALIQDEVLSEGQGIIYCLTHADCSLVSDFLSTRDVSILPYFSDMGENESGQKAENANLESFVTGETRVLAATTKLGMGYDKSDIRFVIHFQLPQNLIAYYQQIGRAGRDGRLAYAILLHGQEDESTLRYFIEAAQAAPSLLAEIMEKAETAEAGVRKNDLIQSLNVKSTKLDEALKYLLVHGYLYKDGTAYFASASTTLDAEVERRKQGELTNARIKEHNDLLEYLNSSGCFMAHVADELDAPDARDSCGICANCKGGYLVPVDPDQQTLAQATECLSSRHGAIAPRKKWSNLSNIKPELQMSPGWTLCADYYSIAGQKIARCKYNAGAFTAELVETSAHFLEDKVTAEAIDCIVPIPSLNRPTLVPDFARKLAESLGTAYCEAVKKTRATRAQKTLLNSAMQENNIASSTAVTDPQGVDGKRILLVDDMVDSRWTFTVVTSKLREAGAKRVYPFALVKTGGDN